MTRHLSRIVFAFTAVFAILALAVAPAAAKTTQWSEDYDNITTESPCGFAVEYHSVGKAHFRASAGRFDLTNAGTDTYTNLENGLSVSVKYNLLFKNFNFVDNSDGTLSSNQTVVGSSTMYGPNGEVLLRTHGPITVHLTINPNATTEEEFFVSREVVFEHGSHDDFCTALTAAVG